MADKKPTNEAIARLLDRIADLLEAQDANPFRVRAYRGGAHSIRTAEGPVVEWVEGDRLDELKALPGIGEGLAGLIADYVRTGQSELLEQLEGKVAPQEVLMKVPGIGRALAGRVVEELGVDSLEELEQAAHDGRLATVEGFGPRRVKAVQTSVAGMLGRSSRRRQQERAGDEKEGQGQPPVALILEVDGEYRRRAEAGELKTIAPKRFNPGNEAWLPVLHLERDGWSFTALYSNTAQAHERGATHDWVVVYYERDGRERQNTVVTEKSGSLKGKRVVRGREAESRRHYGQKGG
jgi:hypothetical protein